MRSLPLAVLALAFAALAGCAHVGVADRDAIARQLAAPSRSADDRERDARDRPDAVLELAGFARGDTIADIFGALIERRAYRRGMSGGDAYDILTGMGDKLDRHLVRAFEPLSRVHFVPAA